MRPNTASRVKAAGMMPKTALAMPCIGPGNALRLGFEFAQVPGFYTKNGQGFSSFAVAVIKQFGPFVG